MKFLTLQLLAAPTLHGFQFTVLKIHIQIIGNLTPR